MGKTNDLDQLILVTGGQTGIDRAVLDFCLERGISCGGWCPEDRMAEDGPIDRKYPVRPLPGAGYRERTRANVKDSEATIVIAPGTLSGGTAYSAEVAGEWEKPLLVIDTSSTTTGEASKLILGFLFKKRPRTVNFSGPRASEWEAGYGQCRAILEKVFGN